jgi:hypothetical protein
VTLDYLGQVAHTADDQPEAEKQLNAALKTAHKAGETALALDVLVALSQVFIGRNEGAKAVELLSLALHHPDGDDHTQDESERLLFELESSIDPGLMTANWERGKSRKLDDAVQELLGSIKRA